MKTIITLLIYLVMMPTMMHAQSYDELWSQAEEARKKDLPQTQMEVLRKIADKARKGKSYGHLLKAQLMLSSVEVSLTPDSIEHVFERLERDAAKLSESDEVAAAVYYNVLGTLYRENYTMLVPGARQEDAEEKARESFGRSLNNPALLARHKADELAPAIEKGDDSSLYGHDLLSVLGRQAEDYAALHSWYDAHGPRKAAMMTALEMARRSPWANVHTWKDSRYAATLDSLIQRYGDLTECGEVAIARQEHMGRCDDATTEMRVMAINEALNRWGDWKRMDELRNELRHLTNPAFSISIVQTVQRPGQETKVSISDVRNIRQLTMRVTRLRMDGDEQYSLGYKEDLRKVEALKMGGTERTVRRSYSLPNDYATEVDSMTIPALERGVWLAEFFADNEKMPTERCFLYVSNLNLIHQDLPQGKTRYVVVDATTGHPVPGAKVALYFPDRSRRDGKPHYEKKTLTTDAQGEVTTTHERNNYPHYSRPETDNDHALPMSFRGYSNNFSIGHSSGRDERQVAFFTDRAIYRPGQTVHVKAVVYTTVNNWDTHVDAHLPITIFLKDANRKTLKEVETITDDMGAAEADFALPSAGLTGTFTITSDKGYTRETIRVEEYKRPTFQVEMDDYEQTYQAGDTITATGHARSFAGVPVQGAKVRYKVTRQPQWWYWWRGEQSEDELASGELTTDDDGAFRVDMPLLLPIGDDGFFRITAEVTVTDLAGESHDGTMSLPLGRKKTAFFCNVPKQAEKDSLTTLQFMLRNAAGKNVDGDVTFCIDNGKTQKARANEDVAIDGRALGSGRHLLTAVCGTDTLKQEFVLFGLDDKRPCTPTHDWFYQTASEFARGDKRPVSVQVGTSDEDVYVVYSIIAGNEVLESGHLLLSDAINTRKYIYQEKYGSGLLLNYAWVKDGVSYEHQATIRRPLPDKRLLMKWTSFRDRLKPGESEQWSLSVRHPDGTPAEAQVVATLYDKSLDEIEPLGWLLSLPIRQYLPYTRWEFQRMPSFIEQSSAPMSYLKVHELHYSAYSDVLMSDCFSYLRPIRMYGRLGAASGRILKTRAPMMLESKSAMVENAVFDELSETTDEMAVGAFTAETETEKAVASQPQMSDKTDKATEQVRENMTETAFFFPRRTTDKDGNLTLVFTLPESITTWKLKGLSHDRDMNHGYISGECVAKKEVMVQPNMPRFIRVGDQATIAARIINTAEKDVSGRIRLLLIDGESENVVLQRQQTFHVAQGKTEQAVFSFSTNELTGDTQPLYICKIVAEGDGFSDGEQHYLPILPDTEWLTNTMPITQHVPGTVSIDLEKLFPEGSTQQKLTVEYTNNPAWLMVQALPFVGNAYEKNAVSLTAAYYANKIGQHIMHLSPAIKSTTEQWMRETNNNENSLMSHLQKNQELKSLVLDETPWVMDAERESDQKAKLMNFFDDNLMNNRIGTAMDNLRKLQNGDGSFTWWPGMVGSPRMTSIVVEMLVRLNILVGEQDETRSMLNRAFEYLDNCAYKEVEEMKKREKEGKPVYISTYFATQWLYIHALSERKLNAKRQETADYLLLHLMKNISHESLFTKSLMAVVLDKFGQKQKAMEYIQSLKEHSVFTEEMGRYFDTPRAYYSWFSYNIPTQVATIEALRLVTPNDRQTTDEMKRWLLQQKRTQCWDTPINSVNAVYAFLNGNINVLDKQELTRLAIDGQELTTPKATAGIGYVKTSLQLDKRLPEKHEMASTAPTAKTFTAEKTSTGTSWGALYAQFMQKTHEAKDAQAGMSVKREVLMGGKPLAKGQTLHVADKVTVRITVKAERDFDFVQVSDKRAACLEPVSQISGYHWGYYIAPKDNVTNYFFDMMRKGTHIVEKDYYVDRAGHYETGICTVQCAYSPEFAARTSSLSLNVE